MCTFIGVECLAANALIELYEQDGHNNRISFRNLADYGLMVVDKYEMETSERAVFIFDQEKIHGLIINYSDYFSVDMNDGEKFICLKDGVDIEDVKDRFRWTLSYELLKAVSHVNITEVVGAA